MVPCSWFYRCPRKCHILQKTESSYLLPGNYLPFFYLSNTRFCQVSSSIEGKEFSFAPTCVYSPSRVDQMDVLIPETITTWVVQAVAINNKTVLSFATLLRIVDFWDLFVSLKLPYSVGRGEQVSLLADRVNYHLEKIRISLWVSLEKEYFSDFFEVKIYFS